MKPNTGTRRRKTGEQGHTERYGDGVLKTPSKRKPGGEPAQKRFKVNDKNLHKDSKRLAMKINVNSQNASYKAKGNKAKRRAKALQAESCFSMGVALADAFGLVEARGHTGKFPNSSAGKWRRARSGDVQHHAGKKVRNKGERPEIGVSDISSKTLRKDKGMRKANQSNYNAKGKGNKAYTKARKKGLAYDVNREMYNTAKSDDAAKRKKLQAESYFHLGSVLAEAFGIEEARVKGRSVKSFKGGTMITRRAKSGESSGPLTRDRAEWGGSKMDKEMHKETIKKGRNDHNARDPRRQPNRHQRKRTSK